MKRAFSIAISLLMIAAMLAGCTNSPNPGTQSPPVSQTPGQSGSNETPSPEPVDYSVHETFTYWLYATPNDYYSDYSENPIVQYLNNKFNVTVKFEQPAAGSEQNALSLMFGTSEYTDVIDMSYYSGSIPDLYNSGVIVDIAEYLDYMPNYKALLESNETFRKASYNDDGHILQLKLMLTEDELHWGGMVYRRDIVETMTGGNVAFPSGNAEPTTVEDWDYMLSLMKMYFDATGMPETAPLIIPYNGLFAFGDLATGFGVNTSYYLENGMVKYGPMEDGFYNYLSKMKEWFEKGYIYKDFASRTNDLFYLPNMALTYGGAAGVWFGLGNQLGDTMSMPEYNLFFDVKPVSSPLDSANGITLAPSFGIDKKEDKSGGITITKKCKDIPKLLSVLDYLYSQEGSMLKSYGLTAEQGAAENQYYINAGLQDGAYSMNNGEFEYNELAQQVGGPIVFEAFTDLRMIGLAERKYENMYASQTAKDGSTVWRNYLNETIGKLPNSLSRPANEDKTFADNNVKLTDYVNATVPKFIMGTMELNETTWAQFIAQLKNFGAEENVRIMQDAYERFLTR